MPQHANTPRANCLCHVVNHCPQASQRAVWLPWQPITNAIIMLTSQKNSLRSTGEERFLHFQNLRTLLPRVGVLENMMPIYSKCTFFFFFFFQLSVIIQNPLELLQQPRHCPIDPTVAIDEVTGYGLIRRAQGQRGRGRRRGGHAGLGCLSRSPHESLALSLQESTERRKRGG